VFLRLDDEHHSLALQEVSEDATVGRQQPGLFHVAFEVDNERKLREIYRRCKEEGIRVSPVDHGISRSFYLNDPSGNGIEVYVDTREKTGDSKWKGRNRALNFDEFEGG
jgi:catechol 2,3-dioxygenase